MQTLYNTVSGKRIAVLGFAFKKDTNDTRGSAATDVVRGLLEESAAVVVYDSRMTAEQIRRDVLRAGRDDPRLVVASSAEEAAANCHDLAVLTEWDEFRTIAFVRIHTGMHKPALLFDGRNILSRSTLEKLGFRVFVIGKAKGE